MICLKFRNLDLFEDKQKAKKQVQELEPIFNEKVEIDPQTPENMEDAPPVIVDISNPNDQEDFNEQDEFDNLESDNGG